MEHFAVNSTIFETGNGEFKSYPRFVTIVAATCAIIFSIIGVLGKYCLIYNYYFILNIQPISITN
jgi:hypothetical protein